MYSWTVLTVFISFLELCNFWICSDYAHNSVAAADLLVPQAEFQWIEEYEQTPGTSPTYKWFMFMHVELSWITIAIEKTHTQNNRTHSLYNYITVNILTPHIILLFLKIHVIIIFLSKEKNQYLVFIRRKLCLLLQCVSTCCHLMFVFCVSEITFLTNQLILY